MAVQRPPDVIGLPVHRALDALDGSGWSVETVRLTEAGGDRELSVTEAGSFRVVRQHRTGRSLSWLVAAAAPPPAGADSSAAGSEHEEA